jgi:hypothetical protein
MPDIHFTTYMPFMSTDFSPKPLLPLVVLQTCILDLLFVYCKQLLIRNDMYMYPNLITIWYDPPLLLSLSASTLVDKDHGRPGGLRPGLLIRNLTQHNPPLLFRPLFLPFLHSLRSLGLHRLTARSTLPRLGPTNRYPRESKSVILLSGGR